MKLLNPSLIQLSLCFLAGTFLGLKFSIETTFLISFISVSLLLLVIYFVVVYKSIHSNFTFTYLSWILFFALGFWNANLHQPPNQELHYMHHLDEEEANYFSGKVVEVMKPSAYYNNYIFQLNQVNNEVVKGKLLVRISKEIEFEALPNDEVSGVAQLYSFDANKSNEGFDYGSYMRNQGVYYQTNIKDITQVQVTHSEIFNFGKFAHVWRENIKRCLEENGVAERHIQFTMALVLGQKKEIDQKIYQDFADAGVVHILAVSGLHVGIVLMFLQFVFSFLLRIKHGRILRSIVVISFLWLFALMAGFSPSVTRAVCMFSFFAVALNLKRKTNTLNLLFASLFPLLLLRPNLLFEVGFQLSYAAVFSIVVSFPVMHAWLQPKWYVTKTIWSIACVSTCAQIGVLPFSLFYFHQFPGLFLFANILILPFLSVLLGGSILLVLWAISGFEIPGFLKIIHANSLDFLVDFVSKIASYEQFVWKGIYFDQWMFIGGLMAVFFVVISFRNTSFGNLSSALLCLTFISVAYFVGNTNRINHSELIVFQTPRSHSIGLQQAGMFFLNSETEDNSNYAVNQLIQNRQLGMGEKIPENKLIPLSNDKYLLIVDKEKIYDIPHLSPTYVLLTDSPALHLERLIEKLQPKQIIADGNNYASFVSRWKETCEKMGVNFHSTYEKGDWRLVVE